MVCSIWYIVSRSQKREQARTGTRFLKFPLLLRPFVPQWPCDRESIMQRPKGVLSEVEGNIPNSRSAKTNATSCARCHSDRRHAPSVPKRRNLLQYCRHLPNRLFSRIHQRIMACIMQNKPNFKMGKIAISAAILKAYVNEQRTMNNEHDSKQTQSKPISNAETAYSACRTKHCRGPAGLARTSLNRFLHCAILRIPFGFAQG